MEESWSPQIPPHQALSDQQVQARMVSVRALRAVLQMPPQSAVTFRRSEEHTSELQSL